MNETNLLVPDVEKVGAKPGMSLREALDLSLPIHLRNQPNLIVLNHGVEIKDIDNYTLNEGDRILVGLLPQGGGGGGGSSKGIIGIIAGIILIVVGVIFEMPTLIQFGVGLLLGGVASLLIKPAALNTNDNSNNQDQDRDSSYYGITGQSNQAKPYGVVPRLYGRHKIYPNIAAQPIVTNYGSTSTIAAIYDVGIGWVLLEDIRIGDTPADVFAPDIRVHTNLKNIQPQLANRNVAYDQYAYALKQNQPLSLRTSKNTWLAELDITLPRGLVAFDDKGVPQAAEIDFTVLYRDVTHGGDWVEAGPEKFIGVPVYRRGIPIGESRKSWIDPSGTVYFWGVYNWETKQQDGSDTYRWGSVQMEVAAYSPLVLPDGTNGLKFPILNRGNYLYSDTWNVLVSAITTNYSYTGNVYARDTSIKPKVLLVQLQFPVAAEYEIYIVRSSPVSTDTKLYNDASVTMLKSSVTGVMFSLEQPHTMIEMSLVASEKLSGVVQNLSMIGTSVLPHYDASGNTIGWFATRNPAVIAIDVLTGPANEFPVPWAQMDWASWNALAVYCDTQRYWPALGVSAPRFTLDVMLDYRSTVKEVVDSILAGCRSALMVTQTGKYGVFIDQQKTVPRQLITPSNSWEFTGSRTFPPEVHALRVGFIDNTREYQRQEILVYADGYDASNATKFEDAGTFGTTDWYRAWAYGRYMMAQAVFRNEIFSLKMDVEHLAVQRGDLVYVQHDVPEVGGYTSRVVKVTGNDVTISQELGTVPTGYAARLNTGSIRQGTVLAAIDSSTFTLDTAAGINPDDIIVLGIFNRVTQPYLIQTIQPEADMAALLTMVKYEPQIYDADIGEMPDWNPGFGDDLLNASNLAVVSASATSAVAYVLRQAWQRVEINFTVNSAFYDYAEIYWEPTGQEPVLLGKASRALAFADQFSLVASVQRGYSELTYLIVPFTSSGLKGAVARVIAVVLSNERPNAPAAFDLDMKRDSITLSWTDPGDGDIQSYHLRYDPAIDNSTYAQSTTLTDAVAWPATSFEVPSRIGTYYIKSRDSAGQMSDEFAVAFTPAENLFNLNTVGVVDDEPFGWPGTRVGFDLMANGAGIVSREEPNDVFPMRSEYYYKGFFDNGKIFQTRFASKIAARPFTANSLMATWEPLSIATPIAGWALAPDGSRIDVNEAVDVWHEIRWFDSNNAMKEWIPLAVADPIAYGNSDFGPWRPFQVGDYTGKFFQFRIIAQYIGGRAVPDAGVQITDAYVDIDMHDRTESQYNISAPAGGLRVNYTPPFKARPAIGITPDVLGTGEYYAVTNASSDGFDIQFFDATATAVARVFDWIATGYGYETFRIVSGTYRAGTKKMRDNKQIGLLN